MKRLRILIPLLLLLSLIPAETAGGGGTYEPSAWTGSPLVHTRFGAVQGYGDKDGTWLWQAIPYAAPPVGELRWRAPRDPEPWRGVRRKRSFNEGCTQYDFLGRMRGSEDCLYLNVWRPRNDGRELPVYVWIHGGGNSMGSAAMVPDYHGHTLAARAGLVFVSINYRLGPFGWFTHPALREGDPADDSGNYGTLDIIKALTWVRDNIAAFGGDPSRVTIAGESAGGFNVLSMLISGQAAGLFHRAVCQSGLPATAGLEAGEKTATMVLSHLLLRDGRAANQTGAMELAAAMEPAAIRSYLRSKRSREIIRCYDNVMAGMIDNPSIFRDGYVIPQNGYDTIIDGTYPNKVPLIIGSNREELKIFLYLSKEFSWRDDLYAAAAKYGSRQWKAMGVDEVARALSGRPGHSPVYAYEFAWGAPDAAGDSPMPGRWGQRLGAFHALEISFFLGTDSVFGLFQVILFTGRNKPGRAALSGAMMDYLAQFCRTGDPNPPGSPLPAWTPWSNAPGADKCLIFDAGEKEARIGMSAVEYTPAGVTAAVESDLPEPLRGRILVFLRNWNWLTGD